MTIFLLADSFAQTANPTKIFIDTTRQIQWLGDPNANDTTGKFTYDTITKKDFIAFKKKYNPQIDTSSTRIIRTDTSFLIKTPQFKKYFRADQRDLYGGFNEYLGFIKPLNLFAIQFSGSGVSGLRFIDSKTGKLYGVESPFDNGCVNPLLSPKNRYFLSYANNVFEDNESFIVILKVTVDKETYTLENFISLTIGKWYIKDIVWINENSFALSVETETKSDDNSEPTVKKYYLKATIKK